MDCAGLVHRLFRLQVLASLCGLLVFASAGTADAWCRTTTDTPLTGTACIHTGIPLAWQRQCISFSVEDPGDLGPALDDVRNAADASFATWSSVSCNGHPIGIDLRQTEELAQCSEAQHDRSGPNMNAILFVEDWNQQADLPGDAFAVTLVWNLVKTGEIVDADMLLNPTLGQLTICGDTCPHRPVVVDLQNVITHEAGHFLGLAHSDVRGATMSATAPVGETEKRSLEQDDIDGICSIYGDLSAPECTTDDFVPDHGFSPFCSAPQSRNGCTLSVPGAHAPAHAWAALGLVGAALWWTRRRRRR